MVIGVEKQTVWNRWKKILPELLAMVLCLLFMGIGISQKEGYHMDELLSFELANARYNPWIVPTQPVGRLAKFVEKEIQGDTFTETVGNLKDTIADVLKNRGNSKLLSYQMCMKSRSGSRISSSGIMLQWTEVMRLIICQSILM